MNEKTQQVDGSDVFLTVAALCGRRKEQPIKGKLWEVRVDEHWVLAVNGCEEDKQTTLTVVPHRVPPYHLYVEFNGWPAGMIHPAAGGWFAAGELANPQNFVKAVQSV